MAAMPIFVGILKGQDADILEDSWHLQPCSPYLRPRLHDLEIPQKSVLEYRRAILSHSQNALFQPQQPQSILCHNAHSSGTVEDITSVSRRLVGYTTQAS